MGNNSKCYILLVQLNAPLYVVFITVGMLYINKINAQNLPVSTLNIIHINNQNMGEYYIKQGTGIVLAATNRQSIAITFEHIQIQPSVLTHTYILNIKVQEASHSDVCPGGSDLIEPILGETCKSAAINRGCNSGCLLFGEGYVQTCLIFKTPDTTSKMFEMKMFPTDITAIMTFSQHGLNETRTVAVTLTKMFTTIPLITGKMSIKCRRTSELLTTDYRYVKHDIVAMLVLVDELHEINLPIFTKTIHMAERLVQWQNPTIDGIHYYIQNSHAFEHFSQPIFLEDS